MKKEFRYMNDIIYLLMNLEHSLEYTLDVFDPKIISETYSQIPYNENIEIIILETKSKIFLETRDILIKTIDELNQNTRITSEIIFFFIQDLISQDNKIMENNIRNFEIEITQKLNNYEEKVIKKICYINELLSNYQLEVDVSNIEKFSIPDNKKLIMEMYNHFSNMDKQELEKFINDLINKSKAL